MLLRRTLLLLCLVTSIVIAALARAQPLASPPAAQRADVVVYGGTPAGVMAAIAAAGHGHPVALIESTTTLAGL